MTTNPQTDLPARLEAALTERFTELGNPFSEMRRHEQGPDGWPASHPVGPHHVTEVLRELLAVSVPASAPTTPPDPTHGLSVQHADALWDAVAIPGPTEPTFPAQHERVCRTVAEILAVLPADRAAIERVRSVLESEAVVGRSALDYRGLITTALMADAASGSGRVADETTPVAAFIGPANEGAGSVAPGRVADETQAPCGRSSAMPTPCSAGAHCCTGPSEAQQPETQAPAAVTLSAAERQFLTFALELAADEMALADGFTDEDHAALETLRRIADAEPVPPVDRCIHVKAIHDTHHHSPVTGCPWCATTQTAETPS